MPQKPNADMYNGSTDLVIDEQTELAQWLSRKENENQVVRTRLKASERVIARVTDGIYRQPESALRELISNAWDADARNVFVLTDAPRFSRIYVRDDGLGMSYETLARLVHAIGGSAKRRQEGQKLGITSKDDWDRTPGGRPLIGKIGIGLFSVSQLARRFVVITKVAGENYRLVAEIRLRVYSEGDDDELRDDDDSFLSGDVYITREPTQDVSAHGTDVVIEDVKPRVRDLLRSADRWRALDEKAAAIADGDFDMAENIRVEEPKYHAGWIQRLGKSPDEPVLLTRPPKLPWDTKDPADIRMSRLIDAVEGEFTRLARPELATTLDTYLQTLWTLALSVPVKYVDQHPFDLTAESNVKLYWISNEPRGQAQQLKLDIGQTVRDAVREQVDGRPILEDGTGPAAEFRVQIDDVELKRPIRFKFHKTDRRGLDQPMLFVGKYAPNLERIDSAQRGGILSLEGYLFWNGRVIPKENNGVLVRIRGASGALFDPTFFNYQVSEQTRLRQITSELFVKRGLDAALNIDRESFNFSHPHVQLVTLWLHRAIRQLTNRHKDVSARLRTDRLQEEANTSMDALTRFSTDVWTMRRRSDPPPEITILPDPKEAHKARTDGAIALARSDMPILDISQGAERETRDAHAKALTRVLAAFGILDDLAYEEQQALITAILRVFYDAGAL
jgi:hypothetical protein